MTNLTVGVRPGPRLVNREATADAGTSLLAPWLSTLLAGGFSLYFATIGGDARWLAALGKAIVEQGRIPDGVPYASAPSTGWENVPVLGEIVSYGAHAGLGDRGFLLLQAVALAACFGFLALDARRGGAPNRGVGLALLLFAVAAFPALTVIRAQAYSLALFPALVFLLRAESRAPSRRIWLLVPLVALWANLHGAVLIGVAVAGAYLLLARARDEARVALPVLGATVLALFATPSFWRTPLYYLGVFENESARRGSGLWARLSFHSARDVVVIVATLAVLALVLRARPAVWELVALAGLAALTIQAARNSVWLAAFAAGLAARGVRPRAGAHTRFAPHLRLSGIAVAVVVTIFAFARGPLVLTAGHGLVQQAVDASAGTAILAENQLAEQVALAGGRVWMANPIDAFRRGDQRVYFDWVEGFPAGDAAVAHAPRAVLVNRGSPADRRLAAMSGFRRRAADRYAVLYLRVTPS